MKQWDFHMKFKNLDINILYILDKHHHYTSGDGFSEPDRFHRAFSDIPGENVSAVMKALHKDGLIYYHEDGEKISITRKGTAKVESFRKCQLGYCHCTSAVLFYLTRSYWQITLMLPQFWRRHNQAGQPGIYPGSGPGSRLLHIRPTRQP